MDNRDNKTSTRQEDQLRVDILADRFELYRTMAMVFLNRLSKEEKIDALLEVIEILNGNGN